MRGKNYENYSDDELAAVNDGPNCDSVRNSPPQFAISPILNALRRSTLSACDASITDRNDEVPSIRSNSDSKFVEHTSNDPDESDGESIGNVVPQFAILSILNSLQHSKSGESDASTVDHSDEVPSIGTESDNTSNDFDKSECDATGNVLPQFAISSILNSLRLSKSDERDASVIEYNDEMLPNGTATDDSFVEHTSNDLGQSKCDAIENVLPQFAISSILNSLRLSKSGERDASVIEYNHEVPSIGLNSDNKFVEHTSNDLDESEGESIGIVLPQFAVSWILNSLRLSKSDKRDASVIDHNDEVPSIGTESDNKFDEHTSKVPDELKHESLPQFAVSSILNSLRLSKSGESNASVIDHNDEVLPIGTATHDSFVEHTCNEPDESECESVGIVLPQFAVSSILNSVQLSKSDESNASVIDHTAEVPPAGTATDDRFVEHTCNEPDESECESVGNVLPQFAISSILNFLRLSKSDKSDASVIDHSDEIPSIMTLTDNKFTSSIVISESCRSATVCQSVPSSNRSIPSGSPPLDETTSPDLYAGEKCVKVILSEVEKLKKENLNLEIENHALRDRVASFNESQRSLQRKVDQLLKKNEELRKTCPRCKHCGKVEKDSADQWEGQMDSQLNIAVRAQVGETYVQLSDPKVEISKDYSAKDCDDQYVLFAGMQNCPNS